MCSRRGQVQPRSRVGHQRRPVRHLPRDEQACRRLEHRGVTRPVTLPRFGRVPGSCPAARCKACASSSAHPTCRPSATTDPATPSTASTGRPPRAPTGHGARIRARPHRRRLDRARPRRRGPRRHGLESTEEYAVTAAASLARHMLDQSDPVAWCRKPPLPADRGPRQLERILEVLALVRPPASSTWRPCCRPRPAASPAARH